METKTDRSKPALISVVAPVFNEQDLLPEFYGRVSKTLEDFPFEILLLDDGSRDRSWDVICRLSEKDPRVRGFRFSRNFGHQSALSAGLDQAKGDAVILIDSDLQDPPEVIPEMLRKWHEGFDVVYGVRSEREGESTFKKWTATLFYQTLRKTSRVDIPAEAGDFRLLSRSVVNALLALPERVRFLRGLSSWVGYKQTGVSYVRHKRSAGVSKYPVFKMLKLASDGITSFSSLPLQMASYLGVLITAISFLVGIYSVGVKLFVPSAVQGWTSIFFLVSFLGGIQLLMIGIIGEYIGRIYEEVKHRPLYLISESTGKPQA